ncbi:PASTA domain-containing protein [Nonomuraea sp. NPDC050328]|uniref:PASTA domain-containing protein n=1 Tax=Nonomuraea sp. NPDC050328 TaxID=3364361 RepID=UPI00378C3FD4
MGYPQQPYGQHPHPGYGPPRRRSNLPLILGLAIGLPLLLLGGCVAIVVAAGGDSRDRTSVAGQSSAPPPSAPATEEPEVVVTVTKTARPRKTPTPKPSAAAEAPQVVMPNVVGMNLQEAQDFLQEKGFFLIRDRDATGKSRFQMWDRNWVVTRQAPAAGRRSSTAEWVTLWAKKISD